MATCLEDFQFSGLMGQRWNALVWMPGFRLGANQAVLITRPGPSLQWSMVVAACCCGDAYQTSDWGGWVHLSAGWRPWAHRQESDWYQRIWNLSEYVWIDLKMALPWVGEGLPRAVGQAGQRWVHQACNIIFKKTLIAAKRASINYWSYRKHFKFS